MPNSPKFDLAGIVREHADTLLAACWGLGWRGGDAEDLVQDTFLTFIKISERFEGRSTVRTFLFGILYKKALEKRRQTARDQVLEPIDDVFEKRFGLLGAWCTMPRGPEDEAQSHETAALIKDCLDGLPVQQRMALSLREVEHETTETLCNILDVSVTHLGVLLFRARNKMRDCVEKKWREK